MKGSKLAGVLVASAIVGLSLGDALTGHGIKGNKNLNPIVVGDGSSSSSSSSGSGSGSSNSGSSSSGSGNSSSSSTGDTGEYSYSDGEDCKFKKKGDDKEYDGAWYDCKPGEHSCTRACVERRAE